MKKFSAMILAAVLGLAFSAGAEVSIDIGRPEISGTGTDGYVSYPNLTFSGQFDSGVYKGALIAFTGEVHPDDEIVITAASGISLNGSASTKVSKIVTIDADRSYLQIQDFLRENVKFRSLANPKGQKIQILLLTTEVSEPTIYCDHTKHYYQHVKFEGSRSWLDCYKEAKNKTFLGRRGYLATITSLKEDQFVHNASDGRVGWLGGTMLARPSQVTIAGESGDWGTKFFDYSDDASSKYYDNRSDPRYADYSKFPDGLNVDGWYWACGPEAGQIFYDTMLVCDEKQGRMVWTSDRGSYAFEVYTVVNERNRAQGKYFNWRVDPTKNPEPNYGYIYDNAKYKNTGYYPYAEPCLTTLPEYGGYSDSSFTWNNVMCNRRDGSPYQPKGYFVEFGNLSVGNIPPIPGGSIIADADAPSLFTIKFNAGEGTGAEFSADYPTMSGIVTNLPTVAQLGFTPPAGKPHFFGWATSADATVPQLVDGQGISDYANGSVTVKLYAVWSENPVVRGVFMTRKESRKFRLKVGTFGKVALPDPVVCDGGGSDTNLRWYAFSAPKGVYEIQVWSGESGWDQRQPFQFYCDLCEIDSASIDGPDLKDVRIWDWKMEEYCCGYENLAGRVRLYRNEGKSGFQQLQRVTGSVFESAAGAAWFESAMRERCPAEHLLRFPKVQFMAAQADGAVTEKMRAHWPALAAADNASYVQQVMHAYAQTRITTGTSDIKDYELYFHDTSMIMTNDDDYVDLAIQVDALASTTDLDWRVYRYYQDVNGVEHYDEIRQTHSAANYSDGVDLGETITVKDGYAILHLKRVGQFALVNPVEFDIYPNEQYKQDESTWGWTNMTCTGTGELKYDRIEVTLVSTNDADRIVMPLCTGWTYEGNGTRHVVCTNATRGAADQNVSVKDITMKLLGGARFVIPSNADDVYWEVELSRADGFKTYQFDVSVSNAYYTVVTFPGEGYGGVITNDYKNVRNVRMPAVDGLGYGRDGYNFYYWAYDGGHGTLVPYLDDEQCFFDISKAFQTSYFVAQWTTKPVLRGDCLPSGSGSVQLVSVGVTNTVSGKLLYANSDPGRYVVAADPGVYDLVYTDMDGNRFTELVYSDGFLYGEGPSFNPRPTVSAWLDNSQAESAFGLIGGDFADYSAAILQKVAEFPKGAHTVVGLPKFCIHSAAAASAERTALTEAAAADGIALANGDFFGADVSINCKFTNPAVPEDTTNLFNPGDERQADPAALLGTNCLVSLLVACDTAKYAECMPTWTLYRRCGGVVDRVTVAPNELGECIEVGEGYLHLRLAKFGAFALHCPVLETTFTMSGPNYLDSETSDSVWAANLFEEVQGGGDRLYGSVVVEIAPAASACTFVYLEGVTNYDAEALFSTNACRSVVRFNFPRTAAEIAELIRNCLFINSEDEVGGSWVRVGLCDDEDGENAVFTSARLALPALSSAVVFAPGDGASGPVVDGGVFYMDWPQRLAGYSYVSNFWTTAEGKYFLGWKTNGNDQVVFGDGQELKDVLVIGATNVLTAAWADEPVVGGFATVAAGCEIALASLGGAIVTNLELLTAGTTNATFAGSAPAGFYNLSFTDGAGRDVVELVTNGAERVTLDFSEGYTNGVGAVVVNDPAANFALVGGLMSTNLAPGAYTLTSAPTNTLENQLAWGVPSETGDYCHLVLDRDGTALEVADVPLTFVFPCEAAGPGKGLWLYRDGRLSEVTDGWTVADGALSFTTTNLGWYAYGVLNEPYLELLEEFGAVAEVTYDIASASVKVAFTNAPAMPIGLSDNLGNVTLDLNGFEASVPDAEACEDGGSPIVIKAGRGANPEGTKLTLVDSTASGYHVVSGGNGGCVDNLNARGGDGGAAVKVETDAAVTVIAGQGIELRGGRGNSGVNEEGRNAGTAGRNSEAISGTNVTRLEQGGRIVPREPDSGNRPSLAYDLNAGQPVPTVVDNVASQYSAWLKAGEADSDPITGTVTFKLSKPNRKTGVVKASAQVFDVSTKRTVTVNGEGIPAVDGSLTVSFYKGAYKADGSNCWGDATFSGASVSGLMTSRAKAGYSVVEGGLIADKKTSPMLLQVIKDRYQGAWTAMGRVDVGGGIAGICLSAKVDKSGKVRVRAFDQNVSSLSCSSRVIVGKEGWSAIPVVIARGGSRYAFILWIGDDRSVISTNFEFSEFVGAPLDGTVTKDYAVSLAPSASVSWLGGVLLAKGVDYSSVNFTYAKATGIIGGSVRLNSGSGKIVGVMVDRRVYAFSFAKYVDEYLRRYLDFPVKLTVPKGYTSPLKHANQALYIEAGTGSSQP